ncbi:MAG TPA: isoprenyl transferase [Gammaproteobacteria bacterium]|jgi:undecaprenyl diphosphate synthase|nr:isoprenyl transferase [Gammaproteobacteria bacterium]
MTVTSALPQHIAVIMDGNGRWAKRRFMPRLAGHRAGVEAARRVVKHCARRGIKVLTLFAFSSENWRRPKQEVNHLMDLLLSGLERETPDLHKNNIRLRFIGDRHRFEMRLVEKIHEVEQQTKNNTGMTLIIAADYGGQWDIACAARRLASDAVAGKIKPEDITSESIASHLSFADLPDPDLFIRTSGEMRISNFILWQLAYSELYFTEVFWPDFNEDELEKALAHYSKRERRYGYSSEQLGELACSNSE